MNTPGQSRRGRSAQPGVASHALGFVAGVQGVWTGADLDRFRHYLRVRRILPTEPELARVLAAARDEYAGGNARLYLCDAPPCRAACGFDVSPSALREAGDRIGIPIVRTGCQGLCKRAPVAALRVCQRTHTFSRFTGNNAWSAVLEAAGAAAQSDSLLLDPGGAAKFMHDQVHDHDQPGAEIESLRFLVGRFRGEGRQVDDEFTFHKEVVGTYEAGGRFLALRMDAGYCVPDGSSDVHRALVVIGALRPSGEIAGRAYTDGGLTHEYAVEVRAHALHFNDQLPDHGSRWKRARKILEPDESGYEERLEVDADDGVGFRPYYNIYMRRKS